MCGRTACTLCPEDLRKACSYKSKASKKFERPEWSEASSDVLQYKPSHNMCPTDVSPVMIAGTHFELKSERIIQPMLWGMIPIWHKGDYKSHGLSTTNCRLEGLTSSKLYSRPLNKGNRCIIVCDGFYEWQTTKGKGNKQPYFIYMLQKDGICVEDCSTWSNDWSENEGWKGPKLLYMAGIFDIWKSAMGEVFYSYSVITMESNETMSWLHHRMPAILDAEEQITGWLDAENVSPGEALALLRPVKLLKWHPVSTLVNNSRNKDPQCTKPISLEKPKVTNKSQLFMSSWLKKGSSPVKREPRDATDKSTDTDGSVNKKIKKEESSE